MNYRNEKAYLLKRMAVNGILMIAGGVIVSLVGILNSSAWSLAGVAIGWLGYTVWDLQRPYYKNGRIRVLEAADAFKPLPKKILKKPDRVLTGEELSSFYEEFGQYKEAMSFLKDKDITHHLAINTELLILQYYEPLLKSHQEKAQLKEIKHKINSSN